MKNRVLSTFVALAVAMSAVSIANAETVKESGDVCFTGEIEYIRTTDKDMAWSWKLDWTFMSDDRDPEKPRLANVSGQVL